MKFIIRASVTILAATATILGGCQKEKNEDNQQHLQNVKEITMHSDDQSRVSNEMDAVINDATASLESIMSFSGRSANTSSLCNATAVADSTSDPKTITITYNGLNCVGNHTRTGTVILSMPAGMQWKDQNAIVTVTYQDFRITRVSDNKSITINGSHQIKNASGGRLIDLPAMDSLVHHITSAGMNIKFDDNSQRSWNVARKRTIYYNNASPIISVEGMHTDGNTSGVAEWGTTRFGTPFVSAITMPLVIRHDCNYRLTGGQIQHQRMAYTATATFGLDANGNATGCPGNGSYYYKLTWTGMNGNTTTLISPY